MDTVISFLKNAANYIKSAKSITDSKNIDATSDSVLNEQHDRTDRPVREMSPSEIAKLNERLAPLDLETSEFEGFNANPVEYIPLEVEEDQTILDEETSLAEEIEAQEAILEDLTIGTPEYKEKLRELADLKNRNTFYNELPLGEGMGQYFEDNISAERQQDLTRWSRELVEEYLQDGELSHTNMGQILDDISAYDTISDVEKAYMWTAIADNKEEGSWIFGVGGAEGDYKINNNGVNPDVIDSAYFNGDATQVHTVVGFY